MKNNKRNNNSFRFGLIIIVLTLGIVGALFSTIISNTKLGLDLQGGVEILYRVEPIEGETLDQDLMDATINTLERRVNSFGISETVISQEGDNLIRVQVPGVEDAESAKATLGSSAVLTFRDSNDNLLMTSDVLNAGKAKVGTSGDGRNAVELSIKDSQLMKDVTSSLYGSSDSTMVIWLDFEEGVDSYAKVQGSCGTTGSKCISSASVNGVLTNSAQITGNFTQEEARNLAALINSGSLKGKLTEEYSNTVGASFGVDALHKSIVAGIVGLILVMVFISFRYRLAGLVSSVGLILYTFFVFVVFYLLGGVLTLPGIAALLLGIGMAIDANVITFERIKDFIASGNSIQKSFELGNKKSMLTIVDAQFTTIIIAVILYIFGQTAIKGFATMLIINIIMTFLITIFYTRFVLKQFVNSRKFDDKPRTFVNYKETSFITSKFKAVNYINKNRIFFTFSIILITTGLIFGYAKGFNVGIDFSSGTSIMVKLDETQSAEFNAYLDESYDVIDANYVDSNNLDVVRLSNSLTTEEITEVNTYLKDTYNAEEPSIQKISPLVGEKLIKNSIYSLLIASLCIVIYITFRFRSSFAFAAIFSLLHDLLIMLSLFALLRFTISSDFIAALLAILGYSINDTIVLFDRIRDNVNEEVDTRKNKGKINRKKTNLTDNDKEIINHADLKGIVNMSVKETIGRSITTSLTTLIPIIALVFLGAMEIVEFNVALAIGIIFGTYSSIFIAAQLWLLFERKGYHYGKKKDGWFDVEDSEEAY